MENKKEKIAIIILAIIIIALTTILLVVISKKETKNTCGKGTKEEHYNTIIKEMESYYDVINKIHFVNKNNPIGKLKLHLTDIEKIGFPMDNFVSYETNEKCDLNESYAMIEYDEETQDYKIDVYYVCGSDTNIK